MYIIVYQVDVGYSCAEGRDIRQWDDGTNANWGTEHDISKCKEECSKRIECGGFLTDFSTGVCGHWQRTPVQLTQQRETNKACYMKKEGKKLAKENSENTT